MRARESAPGAGCTPPASACTRRLTDLAAGAGNSRMTHAIKNTARTRCATPPSGRGLRLADRTTFISHTTRPPAPSKTLAQHPLALGRSSPWVWASAEPLRPSVRTTLRQEPARICTLRRSLRHTQQKMRSRRTEPAAQYQPRPAASAPPHPRSCLLMGKDLWLGGRRQRPPCATPRPARSWR